MAKMGDKIAYYRNEKGWTTTKLAEESGLSQSAISQYENGNKIPSEKSVIKLANALQISPESLIGTKNMGAKRDEPRSKITEDSFKYDYTTARNIDKIKQNSDFVVPLSPEILISFFVRVHDVTNQNKIPIGMIRSDKSRQTPVSYLTEKALLKFIMDNEEKLVWYIEEELRELNMSADQLLTELYDRNRGY